MYSTMKAVLVKDKGLNSTDMYISNQVPIPQVKSDEILIKVNYTALNRADLSQRKGMYPPPRGASEIMGLEVSGTVVQLGDNVQPNEWKIGDRVTSLLDGGGYAEYVTAHKSIAFHVPDSISLQDAVCIPEVYLTAYQTFFYIGGLLKGSSSSSSSSSSSDDDNEKKRVLIHAGGSGVGSALIQLCKNSGRCSHIITTSSKGKVDFCRQMGATLAIGYNDSEQVKDGNWSEVVLKECPEGVDLILDPVGGNGYLEQDVTVCATDGTIVGIAAMGGTKSTVHLIRMLTKRLTITYSTLRSRSTQYKIDLARQFYEYTNGLKKFENGELNVAKYKVFNRLEEVGEAHDLMERNENSGKIVIQIANE